MVNHYWNDQVSPQYYGEVKKEKPSSTKKSGEKQAPTKKEKKNAND